jgi:coenzyme PQQ precursor peptide PqqA
VQFYSCDNKNWRIVMAWKTPKVTELAIGGEINLYVCAGK